MPGTTDEVVTRLNAVVGEVVDLQHAAALLEWDEQVCMPPGGARVHGQMLATIRKVAHEAFTADEVGRLLAEAEARLDDTGDERLQRLLAVTARDYEKARCVPAAFVAEQAEAVSAAQHAWIAARAASAFSQFEPHLSRLVDLKRRYVAFFPPAAHPYDVLLDDFEPGVTTADVRALFEVLRPRQVALIRDVRARPQVDDSFLRAPFPEQEMWNFAIEVISSFGFDWQRGRQDRSVHPFATGIGPDDVRITTRVVEGEPLAVLFGAMHETGHALYEQGLDAALSRTLLGSGASLGVHESQSRLWENLVGRSRPFWEGVYPRLQARFPGQLGGVDVERFYRGINRVQPSLIRVEADEATYNLHIMLRVELEIALIEGTLAVRDLPELWNTRMREYLGVVPETDAQGVLQDIHWSIGAMGYFATYTIGNLMSAQLWEAYGRAAPDRDDQIRRGEMGPLLAWLREQVHRHGRTWQPHDLLERATGSRLDPEPYLRYLEDKYRGIYAVAAAPANTARG